MWSWLVSVDWAVALCVVVAGVALVWRGRSSNFPPGPWGLPVVGYLPFLGEESFRDLIKLGEKFGDVFSVRLGSERVVVLHGSGAIREAFCKPHFLGRPPHSGLEIINRGSPFFASDMRLWREQRRFVVHALKDLGLGRTDIEEGVRVEIAHLVAVLSSHGSAPLDLKTPLSPSMSNNISALVFGRRLPYDHPDRRMLDSNLDAALECLSQTDPYTYFPWLHRLPGDPVRLFCVHKSIVAYHKIRDFFSREIARHKETLDPARIRDFIDSYLIEMQAREKEGPTTLTEPALISTVTDLFEAGSETVRVSILWCVYVAAAFPDVQTRVRQELEAVTEDARTEWRDLRRCPYTHAVVLEVMRWKTIVPLNVLHYTVEDTTVGGYDVPKGTIVIANLWNAHHDPRYWTEPEAFRPERFLSGDGRAVVKSPHFMPFSVGKRACPGETMAYMEVFLYFASLLRRFEVRFPDGTRPDFAATASLNYRKKPYSVRFIPIEA